MATQIARAGDDVTLTFDGATPSVTEACVHRTRIIAGFELPSGATTTSVTVQRLSAVDGMTWVNTGITLTLVAGEYRTMETASGSSSNGYGLGTFRLRFGAGGVTTKVYVSFST